MKFFDVEISCNCHDFSHLEGYPLLLIITMICNNENGILWFRYTLLTIFDE